MATISTRINSSGTYFVNGSFDEITTSTIRTTTNTVYASLLDEVTYNNTSPVIKNLLIYTDSFDNVNWGKGSVSITANSTTAPDGIIVADTIVENTTPSSYHFINQLFNKTATANTYTYSIYAKDAGRSGVGLRIDNNAGSGAVVTYNVATGAIILGAGTYGSFTSASSNILAVGNGWYRISLTATTDASTTVAFVQNYLHSIPAGTTVYTGDGISGIYIWGAQIEQNSTTTIYQGIAATNTLVAPGFAKRETSVGTSYVTGVFDEVTGAPIIDSSVVLWLDPAQPTSYPGTGTTWVDLSISNNTGTLTSASTFDRIDGAGSFNFAITNYATLATNLVPSGSRTIVIAFKTTDITTRAGVISTRDGAGGWFVCLNRAGGGNFTYSLNNVPANNDLQATNAITQTNTWYIAVITHDDVSDVGKIYINGNLIVSATMGEILPISSLTSYVGREINSGNNFPGRIGSVIVYNRALTEDEATQNFNALRRRYGI